MFGRRSVKKEYKDTLRSKQYNFKSTQFAVVNMHFKTLSGNLWRIICRFVLELELIFMAAYQL